MKTAAMILLVLTSAIGCKASEGAACAKPEDCGGGLTCSTRNLCETPASIECHKYAKGCGKRGQCTAKDGECIAATDADCQKSDNCKWGSCTAKDGKCIAATDADCQDSDSCKLAGACAAKDGECVYVAATDGECAKPRGRKGISPCMTAGLCTAKDGRCIATTDDDCQKSHTCTAYGECSAIDGKCVK